MSVLLGVGVGLLTVRLLVGAGHDVVRTPALERSNHRGRAVPTAMGVLVVIAVVLVEAGRSLFGAIAHLFGGGARGPVVFGFDAPSDGPVTRVHRRLELRDVPRGQYVLSEYQNSAGQTGSLADDEWNQLVQCMREVYSPYGLTLTDQQPAPGGNADACTQDASARPD